MGKIDSRKVAGLAIATASLGGVASLVGFVNPLTMLGASASMLIGIASVLALISGIQIAQGKAPLKF